MSFVIVFTAPWIISQSLFFIELPKHLAKMNKYFLRYALPVNTTEHKIN